jgi:cardiolipin synthase (CMP-forming)
LIRALPNLISLARLSLVPVVLLAIWEHRYEWALFWCALAGLSDGLDGFLARRLNAQTRLGAYLDPIADKLLLSGVYLTLGLGGAIPWWLAAVVFGRDALMLLFLGAAVLLTTIRDFPPTIWGKISTAVQVVTALVILIGRTDAVNLPRAVEYPFMALTIAATVWSAIHYSWVGIQKVRIYRSSIRR